MVFEYLEVIAIGIFGLALIDRIVDIQIEEGWGSMKEILTEIREWGIFILEAGILWVVALEYFYDKAKDDEKKHRRTKNTKKTTTGKDGVSIVEESTEVSEPIGGSSEQKEKQNS